MPDNNKSRLDREIDEILQKKAKEPINLQNYRRERTASQRQANTATTLNNVRSLVLGFPLATAFVLAIIGWALREVSPLLALIACTAAVAALLVPAILNAAAPRAPQQPTVHYWRGKPYVTAARDAVSRSPIDHLKRYFDRRR